MRLRLIDYLTIAGLAIFVVLSIVYIFLDDLMQICLSLSLPELSVNGKPLSLPSIPDFNLDWFYSMDQASKILVIFLFVVIIGSAIFCIWAYIKYRRRREG